MDEWAVVFTVWCCTECGEMSDEDGADEPALSMAGAAHQTQTGHAVRLERLFARELSG